MDLCNEGRTKRATTQKNESFGAKWTARKWCKAAATSHNTNTMCHYMRWTHGPSAGTIHPSQFHKGSTRITKGLCTPFSHCSSGERSAYRQRIPQLGSLSHTYRENKHTDSHAEPVHPKIRKKKRRSCIAARRRLDPDFKVYSHAIESKPRPLRGCTS